ncbi:hypothetical protein [Mesorhizobium sp. L-8-3]|uniref:hypothetical protein n=1 Tax=Mesorhizobium sp. L-8-3 TaxID=2744522 RepID=UPI00192639D1|nr:hypothetical protein [Mesorhizobium sp. L-8-3]
MHKPQLVADNTKPAETRAADKPALPSAPYDPTPRERAALEAQEARRKARLPMVRFKTVVDDPAAKEVTFDHPDFDTACALLRESLATADSIFTAGIVNQIGNIGIQGGADPDAQGLNFAMSLVTGIEPQDQIETMLATQMAAVHIATVAMARRLNHAKTPAQLDQNEKALNKLARTFSAQVEALKKYRSKGEQRVIVERVNVEAGGQAVVGNVSSARGHRGGS